MNTLLLQSTVPKQNTRKYTMASFTERIEMAHKLGIELNVGRIDKLTTDNGTKITVIKAMGQPCVVRKDLAEIATPHGSGLRFYEIIRVNNYAKLISTGTSEPVGVPMYWLGDTNTGVFKIQPMLHYFSVNHAFSEMHQRLQERTKLTSESYSRDVLKRQDLIKTSLYLSGTKEYAAANAQFLSILRQQNQQQK